MFDLQLPESYCFSKSAPIGLKSVAESIARKERRGSVRMLSPRVIEWPSRKQR